MLLLVASPELPAAGVRVDVAGVSGQLRANILASLSIYQERDRDDLRPARVRRLHEQAPQEIRAALQPFGYYRPVIHGSLEQDGEGWTARYEVDPADAVTIQSMDLQVTGEGENDPEYRKLIDDFPLRRGSPLNHMVYEDAKRAFQRLGVERGYFDQRISQHEVAVDLDKYSAAISLHIDTGPRYRFGQIHIEQDLLDPDLLAKYIQRLKPGDPYSASVLLDVQSTLAATDFFGGIDINADPQQALDRVIPVNIKLTRKKPNRYSVGGGYGTDTGVRGQLAWDRRYLNAEGHHTHVELRGSHIEHNFTAGYFIPTRDPRTDQIAFTGGYRETDIQGTQSQVRSVAAARTTQRGHLQETLSLVRQNEKFSIGSDSGTSDLLLPGVAWTYVWGDERVYTRFGARLVLELRGASDQVGSDTSLLQTRARPKAIVPVARFGRFIARGDVGTTRINNFNQLPPSLRFYAGGDVSVRGYAYNSLGPKNAEGVVTGARRLLVGSLEYEQRVYGDWSAAIFYDEGNALNDFRDPLAKGAGIGVRWRSPIGQIRFDVAEALSIADRPLRYHLYIGPDL